VEWIDLKTPHLCQVCLGRVMASTGNEAR
jgi:hypothetical protein